ncbi:MAG: HEPN domain-containing protein [Rhodobacterales bacterium]
MSNDHTNILMCAGVRFEDEFRLTDEAIFRPVSIKLDHIELMDRTLSKKECGIICSIADYICFELVTTADSEKDAAILGWNYQWSLILLSLISKRAIFHPISRFCRGEQEYYTLTNFFLSNAIFEEPHKLSKENQDAFVEVYPKFSQISDSRFLHATSVAAHVNREPKFTVRMAAIWSGVEALLGVESELSFRIPLITAKLLAKSDEDRDEMFRKTKRLYTIRSKCVHGASLKIDSATQNISEKESLDLLIQLILWTCNNGSVLDTKTTTKLLLS